jgi:hypothetical protein
MWELREKMEVTTVRFYPAATGVRRSNRFFVSAAGVAAILPPTRRPDGPTLARHEFPP